MRPRYIIPAALLLVGCGNIMPKLPVPSLMAYKMDIQQGNVVTQEMIAKVQPGMTRSQVRFALGTPLIMDPFHSDRWDYVYLYQKAGVVTEQRRIVVVFKDDRLVRIEGDVVPAGTGGLPGDVKAGKPAAAPAKPAPPAPKPAAEPPASAAPASATMAYAGRSVFSSGYNRGLDPWPYSS
jgi:outer membrane protein assembly factor BamE